ncbi:MAG TPA: hypothetical protein VFI06_15350, partial [Chitinophagaceae bacterium]|nr:hypothetical protein [Chitinophagaceae bacterium]
MKWLLFLSRLAFISGFCFLLSLSLLIKDWIKEQDLASTIITIGTFMGMLLVPATLICYLAVLFTKRKLNTIVPGWLIACNIIWMFVYLFYLIFVNGQG